MKVMICPKCGNGVEENTFFNEVSHINVEVIDMETGKIVDTLTKCDVGEEVVCTSCGRKIPVIDWKEMVI